MMDKDFNNKDFYKLLKNWEENRLSAADDEQLSDKLIDFVDENIDIEEVLDAHIHSLAMQETEVKAGRKKVVVISAAASLALLISAAMFFMRENTSRIDSPESENALMAYQTVAERPVIKTNDDSKGNTINSPTIEPIIQKKGKTFVKRNNELAKKNIDGVSAEEEYLAKASQNEEEIAKTLSEIDLSFENLFGNTFEDLSLNETDIIPTSLFFDDAPYFEDDGFYGGNTFEMNLINTFNEMKSYNINLNFETNY